MRLYWTDIETTGLRAWDDILEVAVWESNLETPFDVKPVYHAVLGWDGVKLGIDPFVQDMHTKNGLFEEARKSTTTLFDVAVALRNIVPIVPDREDRPTIAGSSIHFDYDFLKRKLPDRNESSPVMDRFSHRYYDVSAVKLFCRSIGMPKLPRAEAHRANDDVLESVEHARLCADWIKEEQRKQAFSALDVALGLPGAPRG